jgi:hypothetical protein
MKQHLSHDGTPHDAAWHIGHLAHCLGYIARHPIIAAWGAFEFRSDVTLAHDDDVKQESYDSGRELAHIITGRKWDPSVY